MSWSSLIILEREILTLEIVKWLSGAMQAGQIFGFVACDMRFVDERAIFGPAGITLGRARLGPP